MIYTTYYAKLKNLPPTIQPISISLTTPKFYKDIPTYKKLAPTWDILRRWKSHADVDEYTTSFYKILDVLDVSHCLRDIYELSKNKLGACLVCYEAPDKFCHRHLVANWLNQNKIPCDEFRYEKGGYRMGEFKKLNIFQTDYNVSCTNIRKYKFNGCNYNIILIELTSENDAISFTVDTILTGDVLHIESNNINVSDNKSVPKLIALTYEDRCFIMDLIRNNL